MARFLLLLLILVVGCGTRPQSTLTPVAITPGPVGTPLPRPTLAEIPTLLPTITPINQPTPTSTRPPQPTPVPSATVELSQVVIDLEYSIPALGMTRTLTATFASRISLYDSLTGQTVIQIQQARVLLELQTALDGLLLEPVPEGCDLCPRLRYSLPLSNQASDGWLTDPILLASLENYFTIHLGSHWPPNTILGLRRSASPYRPAHMIAFTVEGQLWRWTAVDDQIAPPEAAPLDPASLLADLAELDLADEYEQDCRNVAHETLYFQTGEIGQTIEFRCPELTLPSSLTSLYATLDTLINEIPLAEGESNRLPLFAYTTMLYYQRADGIRLALDASGQVIIAADGEIQATGNLTATSPISLTTAALESNFLTPGTPELLQTMASTDTTSLSDNFLMVRGPEGTAEATWDETSPEELEAIVAELDRLIEQLVGLVPEEGNSE